LICAYCQVFAEEIIEFKSLSIFKRKIFFLSDRIIHVLSFMAFREKTVFLTIFIGHSIGAQRVHEQEK
jgi:hypothetical protein